jgi:SAM-dependent methyltransferase
MLADHCDQLLAADIAASAVAATAQRVASQRHVTVSQLDVPREWPAGSFDLIVLSEVGYYLDRPSLRDLVDRCADSLEPGGALVAVHWRHPVEDYPLGGDEVHAEIRSDDRLGALAHYEDPDFLLDVLVRGPTVSVATAAGLVAS